MERLGQRIAFLVTGDEIVSGDIIDTNTPYFANELTEHSFLPGDRLIVPDDQAAMEKAIRFLLEDHAVLISTGGLGPTSDDRTRFAISEAIEEPLEFDSASWDRIVEKLKSYRLEVPENNRQQCLFPKNAEIFTNHHGTASGCCIEKNGKLIFMIPGPPNECRPMFQKYLLPRLYKTQLQMKVYRRSWMLLGVSEGKIAEGLDALVSGSDCDIGYRVTYPYLEVKLQSTNEQSLGEISQKLEEQIADKLVSRNKQRASDILLEYIQSNTITFSILDEATNGRLASHLAWPSTYKQLFFDGRKADIEIHLQKLSGYWEENSSDQQGKMPILVKKDGKVILDQIVKVPLRAERTPEYATELACQSILKNLKIRLNSN